MIDIDTLKKFSSYSALKETFIIFICTFDPFGKGLPKYTICPKISELPDYKYNDKTTKVFYNANAYKNSANKEVEAFLEYLTTKSATSNFTQFLEQVKKR